MQFHSWILIQCEVCKLTITFNWIFVHFWPRYHGCYLGFSEEKIRAFTIKQNWPLRLPWLNSTPGDEEEAYLAMNLYIPWRYSLFLHSLPNTTVAKPLLICFVLQGRRRRTRGMQGLGDLNFARAPSVVPLFLYIIYLTLYIKWNTNGSVARDTRMWPSRPGFKSQVWQKFNIILQRIFSCRHKTRMHHTSSSWTIHASTMIRSMAKVQGAAYIRSTRWHMIQKVNKIQNQMGLIC